MLKDIILVRVVLREHKIIYSSAKTATCVYYNKGICSQKQTHETKVHVCALCWAEDGKAYPHLKLNVVGVQKMNRPGHGHGFEACP